MSSIKIRIEREVEIPEIRIRDLLSAAFEGGVGYWCEIVEYINPRKVAVAVNYTDIPLLADGLIKLRIDGEDKYKYLGRADISSGLEIMARDYTRHFDTFMAENEDAETGDVFLQCCLFDEVVYG